MKLDSEIYEVLVIGGGPAGLSAALVLGRARRRVLVCDSGQYRNATTRSMHGFITRDGTSPSEFRKIAQAELAEYPSVTLLSCKVDDVSQESTHFSARLSDGRKLRARKLILATGLVDELPKVEGAREVFGQGLYLCPYCDGWEVRDELLCIYGRGDEKGAGMALEMTQWSRKLILCTDGPSELSHAAKIKLAKFEIKLDERPLKKISKTYSGISVAFKTGDDIACRAMFFNTSAAKANDFAERLGCKVIEADAKRADHLAGKTCVPGVYIAGDASRDVLQVIVAAGEGAAAAIALNAELLRDDGVL